MGFQACYSCTRAIARCLPKLCEDYRRVLERSKPFVWIEPQSETTDVWVALSLEVRTGPVLETHSRQLQATSSEGSPGVCRQYISKTKILEKISDMLVSLGWVPYFFATFSSCLVSDGSAVCFVEWFG